MQGDTQTTFSPHPWVVTTTRIASYTANRHLAYGFRADSIIYLSEERAVNTSAKTVLIFGLYLIGMGTGFVLMPNVLLGALGLPATDEVWSRVVGMLALLLAFYYIQAARTGLRPFIQWTVYSRVAVFFFFTAFVLAGLAGPVLILLGAVDLSAAIWTGWALRQEKPGDALTARHLSEQTMPRTQA